MNEIDYSRLSQLGGWDSSVGDGRTPQEIEEDERMLLEERIRWEEEYLEEERVRERRVWEEERIRQYERRMWGYDETMEEAEFKVSCNWKLEGF